MTKKRKFIQTAALFSSACIVAFIGAEILVRSFLPEPQIVHIKKASDLEIWQKIERSKRFRVELFESPEEGGRYFYIMTQTGRRLRANTEVVIDHHHLSKRTVEIRTNSLGYRGPEIDTTAAKKILFLGDSIVMGDYLNERDTFVYQVGELAKVDDRDWAVINAAVSGISLKNELSILAETGVALKPDVVVLGFYFNDY
jgi:hypothetical protein